MPHFIFIQQISVLNILNMLYNLHFFSSKCRLFHNATVLGFCITHILNTGCAKIWKKKSVARRLNKDFPPNWIVGFLEVYTKLMHCFTLFPFLLEFLTNVDYRISSCLIALKFTILISNNFSAYGLKLKSWMVDKIFT